MLTKELLRKLLELRPALACLIVNCGVVAHASLTSFGYENPILWGLIVIPAIPLFAWPCIVVSVLRDLHGIQVRAKPRRLWTVFFGAVVAHACLVPILMVLPREDVVFMMLTFFTWVVGFLGPIYIFWIAARVLVELEERQRSSTDRIFGTFLMYFFLPVGIYFIQRRVQKMLEFVK